MKTVLTTLRKHGCRLGLLGLVLVWSISGTLPTASAQSAETAQPLPDVAARIHDVSQIQTLHYPWRYQPGDDLSWAAIDYDDQSWTRVRAQLRAETEEAQQWNGIGWFRMPFVLDDSLHIHSLAVQLEQRGAAEFYLDGLLLRRFGTVSVNDSLEVRRLDRAPMLLPPLTAGKHVIAIRLSNTQADAYLKAEQGLGFTLRMGPANQMITEVLETERHARQALLFLVGLFLAFGLVHLVFFGQRISRLAPLFLALTALSMAAVAGLAFLPPLLKDADALVWWYQAITPAVLLTAIAALTLFYQFYFRQVPLYYYGILAATVALAGWCALAGPTTFQFFLFGTVALYLEAVRLVVMTRHEGKSGTPIVGWALVGFSLGMGYLLLNNLGFAPEMPGIFLLPYVMVFLLLSAFSWYITRGLNQEAIRLREEINRLRENTRNTVELERRSRSEDLQRLLLENEYQRKTQELEEARAIQRAMLPQSLPALPTLEVNAHLESAFEVSGDYYDFHQAADGTLTLVLGDATGHGMKANALVAATKSLFNVFGSSPDLSTTFWQTAAAMRKMNLEKLYMALLMARFKDDALEILAAGMPSVLIYRAASGRIEELAAGSEPLGQTNSVAFESHQVTLAPNDLVLLMTDGFTGRVSEAGNEMGIDQAKILFAEAARIAQTTQDIVDHLLVDSEVWANRFPHQDDMTFVVLRRQPVVVSSERPSSAGADMGYA